MHQVYLPAWPSAALSSSPGTAPVAFICIRRMALPMVALARLPGPKTLTPEFMPISRATGPLTTTRMAAPIVLTEMACRLNWGSVMALTTATTTGKCSGRQPAMTALMAAFSAVTTRALVGSVPRISDGGRPARSRKALTLSAVGGMMGRPSVQPRDM